MKERKHETEKKQYRWETGTGRQKQIHLGSEWPIVVARLPAARKIPGSNRAADKSLCFHENQCVTQLWGRAAH